MSLASGAGRRASGYYHIMLAPPRDAPRRWRRYCGDGETWLLLLALLLLVHLCVPPVAATACDGGCSGHGACDLTTGRCSCFPGYIGTTCKAMSCPQGTAWVDYASAVDVAHAPAECSNMGACDRATGTCKCLAGFEGPACERMACPNCVNGRCVSLRDAAGLRDDTNFLVATTYDQWDADKIFGCQCDNGFTGWDCSQRACPRGDDPMTTGQLDEIQHVNCLCDGCTGTFALTFRRRTTRNLAPTDTVAALKAALEDLDTLHELSVTAPGGLAVPVCSAAGTTTTITFIRNPGNLPPLRVQSRLTGGGTAPVLTVSDGGAAATYGGAGASQDGTREELLCANRGVCDFNTGVCSCAVGFASGDGAGGSGTFGDCGFAAAAPTNCPSTSNGVCDGHGTCSGGPTFVCSCIAGYTGADCTQRTCPMGIAWFDGPTAPNVAHALAPCSNKGTCDPKTGLCACHALFTGSACEVLRCPGATTACNGRGECKTMQQLALAAASNGDNLGVTYGNTLNNPATWDYNKIQGCDCATGAYLGPYSGALGDFRDYDCTARFCPLGPDPMDSDRVNEKQTLSCQADGGSLTLRFRQQTTAPIAFNANAAVIKSALEKLSSVHGVTVTLSTGTSMCDAAAAITTTIEFTQDFGDLPPLTVNSAGLTITTGTVVASIAESQKGTKANLECSARGECDRTTGACKCFGNYYLSSDGNGNAGVRGDCGYRTTYPASGSTAIQ